MGFAHVVYFLRTKKQLWSSSVASHISSIYLYLSFSELPYLPYFKNYLFFAHIFSKKKPLCLSDFVAKTIFAKQKTNPALPFQKNALPTLPLQAGSRQIHLFEKKAISLQ
jgi:hypothetical protein